MFIPNSCKVDLLESLFKFLVSSQPLQRDYDLFLGTRRPNPMNLSTFCPVLFLSVHIFSSLQQSFRLNSGINLHLVSTLIPKVLNPECSTLPFPRLYPETCRHAPMNAQLHHSRLRSLRADIPSPTTALVSIVTIHLQLCSFPAFSMAFA